MTRLRLALVLGFALLPLLASLVLEIRSPGALHFDTDEIPDRLAEHRFQSEQPLQSEVLSMLVPKWYTMRAYADESGTAVWLYVALYAGSETSGAHDPAVCYPAQGWEASASVERELPISSTQKPVVKVLSATQGGREELVLYWFQPAHRWPAEALSERFLRVLDRLRGRPEYAFVRLSTQLTQASPASRDAASERLTRMALEIAPWVRNAISDVRN